MPLRLQRRDKEILKYVYTYRVVTYDQIRRRFFPKNKDSVPRRRIRGLCAAKLLNSLYCDGSNRPVKCVTLNEKAWPLIKDTWSFEIDKPYFKSESPEHDMRLTEIRMVFEKLNLFNSFISENLLQSSKALAEDANFRDLKLLQSDGALRLKDAQGQTYLYATELEISRKSIDRYEEKISSYYKAGGIDGVIYICADQGIMTLIAQVDKKVCPLKESIVYLGMESDVLKCSSVMFFKNSFGKAIKLF